MQTVQVQGLEIAFAAFDRLIEEARECTDPARARQLDGRLADSCRALRDLLGDGSTALVLQRTCEFARLVLAGGPRRPVWLGILDVDREITRSAMHRRLDKSPVRLHSVR